MERDLEDTPPPAIYDAEALLDGSGQDGRDGGGPDGDGPLHLLKGAIEGIKREADETERLEAERLAAIQNMAGMLRAILADRMVTAPAEELDATDAQRAMRKKIYGSSSLPEKE